MYGRRTVSARASSERPCYREWTRRAKHTREARSPEQAGEAHHTHGERKRGRRTVSAEHRTKSPERARLHASRRLLQHAFRELD